MVEISHFAILDPAAEGWTVEGDIAPAALTRLRSQIWAWPQRDPTSGDVAVT
jgi:hypothetical protein